MHRLGTGIQNVMTLVYSQFVHNYERQFTTRMRVRKPEYPEKAHTHTVRTCKLHALHVKRQDLNQGFHCSKIYVLTAKPSCCPEWKSWQFHLVVINHCWMWAWVLRAFKKVLQKLGPISLREDSVCAMLLLVAERFRSDGLALGLP